MGIVLMGVEARDVPLKPSEIAFDKDGKSQIYADKDGKRVKKVTVQASEYKWVYEDGSEYDGKAYKVKNGKPVAEFKKTTLINKHMEIELSDLKYFSQNEHTYLLVGDELKAKMKALAEKGKGVSFKYVIRGFKVYNAVVYYDKDLEKMLMRCYRGDIRTMDLSEESSVKEITEAVDSLDLDELEV